MGCRLAKATSGKKQTKHLIIIIIRLQTVSMDYISGTTEQISWDVVLTLV